MILDDSLSVMPDLKVFSFFDIFCCTLLINGKPTKTIHGTNTNVKASVFRNNGKLAK